MRFLNHPARLGVALAVAASAATPALAQAAGNTATLGGTTVDLSPFAAISPSGIATTMTAVGLAMAGLTLAAVGIKWVTHMISNR